MLAFFIWEKQISMLFLKQLDLPLAARYSLSEIYDVLIALLCQMMRLLEEIQHEQDLQDYIQ